MEIVFLPVGLILIAAGAAITLSELRARRGAQAVDAEVIGFSTGRVKKRDSPSFHSVAKYIGPDGRTYYVEGAAGSSVPLNALGDAVTVLVNSAQPEKAVLKSALPFVLGAILAFSGAASFAAFWFTFSFSVYSLVMALVVLSALAFKARSSWPGQAFSLEAWQEYKKEFFSPRVFTNESKDQISWADPISISVAKKSHKTSARFALPLLFALGFAALFLSHHFYQKTEAFLGKADRAAGLVVDLKDNDSSDSTTYAAVVEYRDGRGQKHRFVDSLSSSPPSYRTGQTVTVLYNRENPLEAQIDRGRANYWLTYLLGSVGGLLVLLGAFSARRAFQKK